MVNIQEKYTALRICILVGFTKLILSQVAPKLTPLPRELEFKRGERFQLVCSCREGEPPLTFNWVRNGQPLMETVEVSVRRFDEFSSSITITAVREDHTGNYTCIVSNLGGSDSSTVRLRVLVPPTWLRQPYDMSVLAGTRVTLNCETAGTPKPTITWRRNKGFNIQLMEPLGSNQWRTADDGSLANSNIKKDDEGFYTCEVSNGVGEGLRKTVRIEVQVPPSVSVSEAEQTVKKGETAKLKCEVTGDSPLTIAWTKANQHFPVANEERIEIEEETQAENTSSSVVLQKTTAGDTGLYFCTARNSFGQSQAAIRLRVVEHPSTPLNFRVSEVWCKSVRLAWKQPYNGNSPLKNYLIKYKKKDATTKATEIKVPDSQTAVTIHDLRPFTAYEFQITAENVVGLSSPSQSLSVTTRVEEPESPPTNVYVKSKDATGFLLNWKAPPVQKWNGELLGFYIGYKRVSHGSAEATPFTYKRISVKQVDEYEHYIGGLQESSTYTAIVRAFNQAGIGPSSEQIIVKTSYGESPQVPIISLLHADQSLIRLKVESPGNHRASPNGYVLHIREGSSHWKKIPLIPVKEEYTVAGLTPGGHYKLYVTARNKFGDSGPSEVLTLKMEPEDSSGSMFHYEEDIAVPFYQRLLFIIPVAVSLTTTFVVPLAACCCLRKLGTLPAAKPEGVEARGFTYTAASAGECATGVDARTLSQVSTAQSSDPNQGHYSTLQNYGSVIPSNPRFSQIMEEVRRTSQVNLPPKQPIC